MKNSTGNHLGKSVSFALVLALASVALILLMMWESSGV